MLDGPFHRKYVMKITRLRNISKAIVQHLGRPTFFKGNYAFV